MRYLPIILIFFISTPLTFAQTISLGEVGSVSYTDLLQTETGDLYYNNDGLVLSIHDTDGDGTFDTWLQYRDDVLVLEGIDTNKDEVPDVFNEIASDESLVRTFGEGEGVFTAPEQVSFESLRENGGEIEDEDLVGDLSSITIPGGGGGVVPYFLLVVIAVGAFIWWSRKQRTEAQVEEK